MLYFRLAKHEVVGSKPITRSIISSSITLVTVRPWASAPPGGRAQSRWRRRLPVDFPSIVHPRDCFGWNSHRWLQLVTMPISK